VAIFESGNVYRAYDANAPAAATSPADEHHALGALLCGGLTPRSWRGERIEADFFAAKALLAGMLDRFKLHWAVQAAEPERWPFLHPGRSAEVLARTGEGQPVTLGFLGEVHPLVAGEWDLPRTAAFAVDLGKLATIAPEVSAFEPFGAFPVLRQDIAVVLPETISAREVGHAVRKAGGKVLGSAEIFDVYTGEQVGEGRRSLALALSFRSLEGTLTDEDVAPVRDRIVAALEEIGGELRG
jgi:phenylalanyl-tRNA synthetase beta chain